MQNSKAFMILFKYAYAILQEKALFSQKENFSPVPVAPWCDVTTGT